MVTLNARRNARQSWVRRLWPFPVIGSGRAENPRVGGSTPSQATTYEDSREHTWNRLGGLLFLAALLAPLPCAGQEAADPWGPPPPPAETAGRLRAASLDAAWIGGSAALDLGVSRWGIDRGRLVEVNPLMRSGPPAVAMKAAVTVAGVVMCDHLRQRSHPRGARIVRWVIVGAHVALAGNALVQARR